MKNKKINDYLSFQMKFKASIQLDYLNYQLFLKYP